MCGIVGVTFDARRPVGRILRESLQLLEYRGYDSVGIAVADGERIVVRKGVGMVADVAKEMGFDDVSGVAGIGHTRWATHGGVTPENAHPHTDCKGRIAVVHNGIIDNYAEIRRELEERGHVFRSETDSEVIAHLAEEVRKNPGAIMETLEGSFAFVVLFPDGTLLCGRRGAPLVVGRWAGGVVVASDPLPITRFTRRFLRLGDGEWCLARGSRLVYEGRSRWISVSWSVESAEKGGFAHFMEKEIFEQPVTVKRTLAYLRSKLRAEDLDLGGRVHLVAAGTSYHAALYGELLLRRRGTDARAFVASEYPYWKGRDPDVVIAVSQSGETADVLRALRGTEARVIAITNVPGSSITAMADTVVLTQAGPEIGVAATKTFTAQLTALAYIARGNVPDNIPSLVYETLVRNKPVVKSVARWLSAKRNAFYLGRGISTVVALEGALKLKEIAYIHAEGYPAGESKHGPIALVEPGFPVVVVAPKDETYEDVVSNAHEMAARGAEILAIANEPLELARTTFTIPYVDSELSPILSVLPLQMLAYYTATERGLNPDRPRNLAKSVTVK